MNLGCFAMGNILSPASALKNTFLLVFSRVDRLSGLYFRYWVPLSMKEADLREEVSEVSTSHGK